MKISKKVWLIIGVAILVIALVSLVRIYTQQVREQEQLKTSLAAQQALSNTLTTNEANLENRLSQAESLFDTSQAKFPESVESIEYGEDLFNIAEDCNVELIQLSPSMPTDRAGGAVTYSVASFSIVVKGDVNGILDFINALKTGDSFRQAWSAEVNSVSIDIGDAGAQATINLDIYGYRG